MKKGRKTSETFIFEKAMRPGDSVGGRLYILPLLPALAAAAVCLAVNGMDDFVSAGYSAGLGISGCLMALLFFLSWKAYKNERIPICVSILSGVAAMFASYITCYRDTDLLWEAFVWLLMIFPVILVLAVDILLRRLPVKNHLAWAVEILAVVLCCVVLCEASGADLREEYLVPAIWLSEGVLWSSAVNAGDSGTKKREWQWKAWLITLGILYLYICAGEELRWKPVQLNLLHQVAAAFAPFFYPLLFRRIAEKVSDWKGQGILRISGVYWIAALIFTWIFSGGLCMLMSDWKYSPDMTIYGLLMMDVVYAAELRGYHKKQAGLTEQKHGRRIWIMAVAANIVGALLIFWENERVRTILYDIGFGGMTGRVSADWLGYRMTALGCFFAGNTDLLDKTYGAYGWEGYESLLYDTGFAAVFYRQGIWWLLILAGLVLAAAVSLFRQKGYAFFTNRCRRYLAVSYGIRTAAVLLFQMFFFTSYDIQMPFTGYAMADLVILMIFLLEGSSQKKQKTQF